MNIVQTTLHSQQRTTTSFSDDEAEHADSSFLPEASVNIGGILHLPAVSTTQSTHKQQSQPAQEHPPVKFEFKHNGSLKDCNSQQQQEQQKQQHEQQQPEDIIANDATANGSRKSSPKALKHESRSSLNASSKRVLSQSDLLPANPMLHEKEPVAAQSIERTSSGRYSDRISSLKKQLDLFVKPCRFLEHFEMLGSAERHVGGTDLLSSWMTHSRTQDMLCQISAILLVTELSLY